MTKPLMAPAELERPAATPGDSFDFREYISFIWRHWPIILVISGCGLAYGYYNLWMATPVYYSSAQLLLDPPKERVSGSDRVFTDLSVNDGLIESQIAVMRSDELLAKVVRKDAAANPPQPAADPVDPAFVKVVERYVPTASPWLRRWFSKPVPVEVAPVDPKSIQSAIDGLRGSLSIFRTGQGGVISIGVTSTDPVRAARLANAVADAYIVDKLDARYDAAKRASEWLNDRLVDLGQQLRKSEDDIAQFRAEHGLTGSGASGEASLTQQQLSDLNAKLVAARGETAEKKAKLDFLVDLQKSGGTLDLPNATQSPEVGALKQRLAAIQQREAELRFRYSPRHPAVSSVEAERRDAERALQVELRKQLDTARSEFQLAQAKEQATEIALKAASGQSGIDEKTAIRLRELERTAAVNKSLFEDFLQRARLTDEQATFQVREARVIVEAKPSWFPSSPNATRMLALPFGVALAFGVGLAFLLDKLKAGFTTASQVEQVLGLPVIGSLPRISGRERRVGGRPLPLPTLPLHKPLSRYSETVRTLRSGVQLSDVDRPPRIVQVTSARPGEGKTTISLSLAASAAMAGQKVLLVDCDLRRRSATLYLKADKERGLVDYLGGEEPETEFIRHDEELDIDYLPAGSRSTSPPDLLQSEKLKLLLAKLRDDYAYIVLDSPPAGPIVDARIISYLADKVVFVVQWDATPREMAANSVGTLKGQRKIAGVLINLVNEKRARRYSRQAYHYTYGDRYYGE